MKKLLQVDGWERADHFRFFKEFDEPFFGVCVDIDCTKAYAFCKDNSFSFFLFYLHKALLAANEITPFKYRIEGENVYVYDKVNASPIINRQNGTFGFAYMDYNEDFEKFHGDAAAVIDDVKKSSGLKPAGSGENVIHFSSLPWINFTSISHARNFSFNDSCPKISFGKMAEKNNVMIMPISVHVHHALMDGYDVSQFIDRFQWLMDRLC